MTFITERIAVGSSNDAKDPQQGITGILNTALDLDVDGPCRPQYERQKVGLIDGPGNSDYQLVAAVLCLRTMLARNAKVLVHCHAGRSRSVTVIAVHLALEKAANVRQVIEQIRVLRPEIQPHEAVVNYGEQSEAWLRRLLG